MAEEVLDIEMIAMTLIGHAGETKSLAYQAMNAAKEGKFDEAEEFMKKSTEEMLKAHELQTDLIVREAGGEKMEVGLIMVHSQESQQPARPDIVGQYGKQQGILAVVLEHHQTLHQVSPK